MTGSARAVTSVPLNRVGPSGLASTSADHPKEPRSSRSTSVGSRLAGPVGDGATVRDGAPVGGGLEVGVGLALAGATHAPTASEATIRTAEVFIGVDVRARSNSGRLMSASGRAFGVSPDLDAPRVTLTHSS